MLSVGHGNKQTKIEQAVYLTIVTVGLREQSIHMTTRVDLQNLHRVQNIAARMGKKCEENSLACLKKLHWVPIILKIKFKILTMLSKAFVVNLPSKSDHWLSYILRKEQDSALAKSINS